MYWLVALSYRLFGVTPAAKPRARAPMTSPASN